MSVSSIHYISLVINKGLMELESQQSLGIKMNKTLFDPTKSNSKQTEYSFSFKIPSTPNNDRILDYANMLAKNNKFRPRYECQVYADGTLFFDGSLTIEKFKDGQYTCNLVSIKFNQLDEIFGESTLTDVEGWDVDFEDANAINTVNSDMDSKYYFPLVAYGAFQKTPQSNDGISNIYSSKQEIDETNKWWIESFYPSLNVMETIKKCFEWKGYTVDGTAFRDPVLKNIYASCNLADEQVPTYNIGNPRFGKCSMNISWNNYDDSKANAAVDGAILKGGWTQSLKFPYEKVRQGRNSDDDTIHYNFESINLWNMMDTINNRSVKVNLKEKTYMYQPGNGLIVVPADGFYRIDMYASCSMRCPDFLVQANRQFTAPQWTNVNGNETTQRRDLPVYYNFNDQTPIEIQLVRNYNDNAELIKGRFNVTSTTGNWYANGTGLTASPTVGYFETEYPHENLYAAEPPTKTTELQFVGSSSQYNEWGDYVDESDVSSNRKPTPGGQRGAGTGGSTRAGTIDPTGGGRLSYGDGDFRVLGFMHKTNSTNGNMLDTNHADYMGYDPAVSDTFVCGLSSMNGGTAAVLKNGVSWTGNRNKSGQSFYLNNGYQLKYIKKDFSTAYEDTNYGKNVYDGTSQSMLFYTTAIIPGMYFAGRLQCVVYLRKNDVLEMLAIQRDYEGQRYGCEATVDFTIEALTPKTMSEIGDNKSWVTPVTPSMFPKKLNLFEFTNAETKVADWIQSVCTAFNLTINQVGNNVDISTNKGASTDITYAVDIDDRVKNSDIESSIIQYPKDMAVKYKIDKEEYGFELTVPQDYIDRNDWYEYGDSGYTVVKLNDDLYATKSENVSTQFSYTYYDTYKFQHTTPGYVVPVDIRIPIIEKSEYMVDGYNYDEAMLHDGYSLTQRFWYRDNPTEYGVTLSYDDPERIALVLPKNEYLDVNLSYKDNEKSLLTEYFNFNPMIASNFITVDTYISPIEYNDISSGVKVRVDSDNYIVSEIKQYDPSLGSVKLKLVKDV